MLTFQCTIFFHKLFTDLSNSHHNFHAERIKERRLTMDYTQEELAEKLGLQKSAVAKYENGRVENIKRSVIAQMANILKCNPAYLLDWSEEVEEQTLVTKVEQNHLHKHRAIDDKGYD